MKLAKALLLLPLLATLAGCSLFPKSSHEDYIEDRERTAKQIYDQAQRAAQRGNWDEAVERFETLQARYPFGSYAEQAQLDIIYVYYQAEEWDSVIAAADRFMRLNPTHERVDYALYMRASAHRHRGRDFLGRIFKTDRSWRDPEPLHLAFNDLKRLVTEFPESQYADDARDQMLQLRDWLARHEIHVARFYMERDAFVAAANRAKAVIENYQETPAVREALEILAKAYGHLEMGELREDVLRVIQLNYPDHPLVRKKS